MNRLETKKQFLLLFIVTLLALPCFAQVDSGSEKEYPDHTILPVAPPPEEIFYRGSIQAGGGIVYPVSNKALRTSLGGVYYLHLSGNYIFAPHFFGGLELENTQLGNTGASSSYNTVMFIYSLGLKAGYYTYMQKDFLFCYSLSAGPSLIVYSGAPNPAPKGGFREQSYFITPNLLAAYRVNNELRIGLEVSYIFMGYHFDPATTGINNFIIYDQKDASAITTYAEWGFAFYWAFDEAKR